MRVDYGTGVKTVSPLKKIDNDSKNVTNKVKKLKQKKRKKLIIRNLSFKVSEDDLKDIFSKFGAVKETKIPLKEDGKKRGFGFVEFEDTKSLISAMKAMNWKEIHGRKVAVDFAVDKSTYQLKVQALKQEGKDVPETNNQIKSETEIKQEPFSDEDEEESEDEEEKKLNDFLKDFYSGAEKLTKPQTQEEQNITSDESSSEESENEGSDTEDDSPVPKKKIKRESDDTSSSPTKKPKKESHDVSEGKTVFLRNVSFATTQESLKEVMEEYGECEYCLLCMDQFTDHPKGTAFVKFTEKDSADKLVKGSFGEPGVLVGGRKLTCSYAMSREDVSHVGEDSKKPKDKRNLNLIRVGLIMPNSKESEGVSPSDMAKRAQLEIVKKQKLKNVNFFVSDKRLMVHNLPKTFNDEKLRKLLKKTAGKGAVITEARVMKEFKRMVDGTPLSKGYGFACFSNHEDALKVLNELNNNPSIFTSLKRPILEFSVENKVALLSQERRKEKVQMRNKRRTDEKRMRKLDQDIANAEKDSPETQTKNKKRRKKNKNNKPAETKVNNSEEIKEIADEESSSNTQKKKNKKRRKKNKNNKPEETKINNSEGNKEIADEESSCNTQKEKKRKRPSQSRKEKKLSNGKSQQSMTNLVTKFKDKLINKIT